MKLNHIALNISNVEDTIDFYQNILGFNLEYQFELPKELSINIFGVNNSLPVFFYKKEQISIELFVFLDKTNKGVSHICLETHNSEQLISQCQNKGYKVFNIERDNKPNLLFVWDKSGNCFEIKDEKSNN